MKKNIKSFSILFCIISLLSLPYFVFANEMTDRLDRVAGNSGYTVDDVTIFSLSGYIGIIVSAFLSLLGIIFIVLILWGGYNWMIAGGDESKVTKAKDTIQRAVIGLIIVLSSYAIWAFIANRLMPE